MDSNEMKTIEEWAKEKNTADVILEGWGCGKSVSESEYDEAVELFTGGPADGRK